MGSSHQQTSSSQSQQSQTQPYAPTQPLLQSILNGINTQIPNYAANGAEQGALGQLNTNAQNLPNFAPQATSLANSYLTGDPTGLLNSSLSAYQNQLNPIANASLDPTQVPGIQNVLQTIQQDVGNSVNGMFAGAGRDLSGANTQTLARGIAQGEAEPLLNQYNQNVQNRLGAAANLYGAAGTTAGAIGQNQQNGFNFANLIPSLQNASPLAILQAQAAARGLPLGNLAQTEALTVPIAGLGSQSSGSATGTSTGTYTPSLLTQIGQGTQAFGNLFGGTVSPFSNFLGLFPKQG